MNANEIFVFGSNYLGIHKSGAAKTAIEKWGATYGLGEGIQGQSYALPTKRTPWVSLPLNIVKIHIRKFCIYAFEHPDLTFLVTRVGCGLAGFKDEEIAPEFDIASKNCVLDTKWQQFIISAECSFRQEPF